MNKILLSISTVFIAGLGLAQMSIPSLNTSVTEDFNNFNGSGFASAPTAGQLDSDTWRVTGLQDGDAVFGDEQTGNDFGKGGSNGGVTSGGFYSFFNGVDSMLGVQPTGSDWTSGEITLKIQNNTGAVITSIEVAYDVWVLNNGERANSFNFAHSADDVTYSDEASLDFTSIEASDALGWVETNQSITISSLNIANGEFYYLQWIGNDETGGGSRDEFGLDDISITAQGSVSCTQPQLDAISDMPACDSVMLPAITGTDLTGNEAYFTEMNGAGTMYDAGDYITSGMTLYAYDEDGVCNDEEAFDITIAITPNVDALSPQEVCDSLVLPVITGTNLTGNEAYYSGMLGTGDMYEAGDAVLSTTTLYIYDSVTSMPSCNSEEFFDLTVFTSPTFDMEDVYSDCDSVELELIVGNNLSGNEAYYSGANGSGDMYSPGDYITSDMGIYIYDESGTLPNCITDELVIISIVDNVSAGNDIDSSVIPGTFLDLEGIIDGDNGGDFVETTMPATGEFDDVNFTFNTNGLAPGQYTFEYIIQGCNIDTALVNITVLDTTVSIAEFDFSNVSVYPNPTQNEIYIDGVQFDVYALYDLSGKMIDTRKLNNNFISVAHLEKGIYILELKKGNQLTRKRIIKD